jgi:hypothetical protein
LGMNMDDLFGKGKEVRKLKELLGISFLDDLVNELQDAFSEAAFSDKDNRAYIKMQQKQIKSKYGEKIERIRQDADFSCIVCAYDTLQSLLKTCKSHEEIKMTAEKALYDYRLLPRPDDSDVELPCEMPADLEEAREWRIKYGHFDRIERGES